MVAPRALAEFVAEATELLETFGRELLALEASGLAHADPDRLNAIFRTAHSLKGLASMFGLEAIAHLAHRAEDVLDALRLGRAPQTQSLLDLLGQTVDLLQAMLGEASRGEASARLKEQAQGLSTALAQVATGAPPANAPDVLDQLGLEPQLRAVLTQFEEHRLKENIKKGASLWKVRVAFPIENFDVQLTTLAAALKTMGEVVSTLPSPHPGDPGAIGFELLYACGRPKAEIASVLPADAVLSPVGPRPLSLVSPPSSSPSGLFEERVDGVRRSSPSGLLSGEQSLRSLTNTVRVDIGRLDGLMNSIGELLLIRSNIDRLADGARQASGTALPKLWGQELQREARALERKLDDLQKRVLEVRMVPLGQVFDKLARLMKRLVRESGKEVIFSVSGGDVELDKLIVEELTDPLMHLLRNALDHGVEQPSTRIAQGKVARATISLVARQQGNQVIIEVGDDGAGLDDARILEVAVKRGVLTAAQAETLDRRDLLNLVFQPGFSTRNDVSELSGRGVGLDVVKTNLQHLSGLIDISSRRAEGTTFTLTLPLTLAIIRALMVKISGRMYAIPLNAVLEITTVKAESLRTIEKREVLDVRGQTTPFVRLAKIFGLEELPRAEHFVVLVGLAQQRLGLAVDELLGQQDIVTKPLGGRLKGIPGLAGATELGDRRAVLVLDVGALMEEFLRSQGAEARAVGGRS